MLTDCKQKLVYIQLTDIINTSFIYLMKWFVKELKIVVSTPINTGDERMFRNGFTPLGCV